MLQQRIEYAEDRRDHTEYQDHSAPPPWKYSDKVEDDAHHPVNGGLEHHTAHQGRHVRRRDRMRLGQPDMERDNACLCREPEKCQQKGRCRECLRMFRLTHGVKGISLESLEPGCKPRKNTKGQ